VIPEYLTDYLFNWLESYVETGEVIKNEETLQFGFSLLKFIIDQDGITSILCLIDIFCLKYT